MKRKALPRLVSLLCLILALTSFSLAQLASGPGITSPGSSLTASNRTFSFAGTIPGQLDGALSVTFSIYPDQQSATALWTETQVVQVTGEKYNVMLGSNAPTGLPAEIFAADQAHWLGVQVNGAEKRYLLVSVPYAMKAVEAERLGGLLPSDYVTVQQLQSALQSAAAPGSPTHPKTTSTGPTGQAAAAGTPAQPATDFTDNNTSEVLLVTQQGTGFAIHAITSSQAEAILAQNDSVGGVALHAFATNATGAGIGILAETAGPDGIAGVFNSKAGGKILSLRNNGVEEASVDASGNLNASGQVQANSFSGGGFGLFGIPQSAINATPLNLGFSVVARDGNGDFAANQITATSFSGGGFGLFGIPQSAINATPLNLGFSVVARDSNGSFAANEISATSFSGGGFGLFGIPQSAINATPLNIGFSVVARDSNGGFATGNLQVTSQLTSSGLVDFSGAVTAPVRTVLTANIPPLCLTSKELLLVTDAVPGQQLFVCNSNGNGWTLLGDGGGSGGSSNISGNTTGTLENVSQLGTGTALTVSSTTGTAVSASSTNGTAIHGQSTGVGLQGSSQGGIGIWAAATANDSTGTALLLSHVSQGKLIDGGVSQGAGTDIFETFSVTAEGDVTFNGAMMTPYETTGTWFASSLVKLTSIPGNFGAGTVTMTSPGDTSGAIGIISGLPASGSRIQVVQSGQFMCNFDGPATSGHYVGISKTTAGDCADIGASYPTDGQQVVGRVLSSFAPGSGRVLLFQSELHSTAANTALSAETSARQSADATLQANIDSESAARQAADTTLQNNINAETAARQAADTTLQNNITAETSARQADIASVQAAIGTESAARQSVEASLFSSISAETAARQSDVSTLQTNINNVSAADAKLAASNTFTAGTQDFSGAGATLPVRSVLTANTPASCVAGKELLIKTDAPAGQQLFICAASGTAWNLVGDGAANGVLSFNGRNGSVSPASGDYSFAQISGSATASQLPATVAYNNQSNTFTGNQTVNGSVTATSFSGSGSGLTGVNAASLNGIPSNAFAQLHAINTFTSEQAFAASTAVNPSLNIPAGVAPATPLAGDLWSTGNVLQYRDNASTTRSLVSTTQSGGLQLLRLTASITPTNVTSQGCTEQSFTVSGITTGDTLLNVSQPSTSSPGTNIAIGGFRVPAANTVAIQFCNVSRNNSTPTSGVYTFALMR